MNKTKKRDNLKSHTKKNNNKSGGGLFDKSKPYVKALKKAASSETKVIDTYTTYYKAMEKYDKAIEKHLENLMTLDEINKMGSSFLKTFKEITFPELIEDKKKVDMSNPILLKNYMHSSYSNTSNFRKEHVINQILYQINKLNKSDKLIIEGVDIQMLDNNMVNVIFKTRSNRVFERSIPISDDYILDVNQIIKNITDIISKFKGTENRYKQLKSKPYNTSFEVQSSKPAPKSIGNTLSEIFNTKSNTTNKIPEIAAKKPEIIAPENIINAKLQKRSEFNKLFGLKKTPVKTNKVDKYKQMLAQQRQVLNTEGVNEEGKTVFGIQPKDELEGLLYPDKAINKVGDMYKHIDIEKLKKLDLSQITDPNHIEVICNRFSEHEDTCKAVPKCWFNPTTNPKCYRFKEKSEAGL